MEGGTVQTSRPGEAPKQYGSGAAAAAAPGAPSMAGMLTGIKVAGIPVVVIVIGSVVLYFVMRRK